MNQEASLSQRIAAVARDVSNPRRSRGDRAELRRMGPSGALPAVFWSIVERHEIRPGREEDFFVRAVPLMAMFPHRGGVRPGKALREAKVKEPRFERWLRHDSDSVWDGSRRLLTQLKGGLDWGRFGSLLFLWDDPEHGEKARMEIARDFFLTRSESGSPDGADETPSKDES